MADQKISELTALTGANVADDDAIAIVDTSATETKKIVFSELKNALDTATGFVRITGDTMTGNLSMGDNVKAIFGAGSDLEIYHNGTNSIIADVGTGNIEILGNNLRLKNADASNSYLNGDNGGGVTLYHAGTQKFITTSTGIQVTGNIANATGDLTLDVAGNIILDADGGLVRLYDGSAEYGRVLKNGNNLQLQSQINDGDLVFKGIDNNSTITALTLDMSEGGRANFNNDIGLIDNRGLKLGSGDDSVIYNDGSNTYIRNNTSNQDIIFQGNDDGSANITALTLDMSASGNAIFNNEVFLGDTKALTMGASNDFQIFHDGGGFNQIIAVNDHPIQIKTSSENMIKAIPNGGVELYHNNSKKIETTAAGATVTGGLSVTGDLSVGGAIPNVNLTGTSAHLPSHYFQNTYDGTNIYWHVGPSGTSTTNKVLNIRIFKSDGTSANSTWNPSGLSVTGTVSASNGFYGDGSNLTGVGASTTNGAVGTYALLWRPSSTTNNWGDTIAGSNLRVANTFHNGAHNNFGYGSTSVSGTWRCMCDTGTYNGGSTSNEIWLNSTVWVRIS